MDFLNTGEEGRSGGGGVEQKIAGSINSDAAAGVRGWGRGGQPCDDVGCHVIKINCTIT